MFYRSHGGFGGRGGDPGGVVLGHDGSVRARRLGRAQDGSQVAWILDLVQEQEEGRLPPLTWNSQELIQRGVARTRDPSDDALMVRATCDGRQLIAGPVRDLDTEAPGQAQQLLEGGAAALGENGDLLHSAALGPQELEHGVAPAEGGVLGFVRAHEPSVHVVAPSRESLSVTPSAVSSSRSRSASAKSRCLRA